MSGTSRPIEVNGWKLYAHPCFTEQLKQLVTRVESLRQSEPETYQQKVPAKLLAAIVKLMQVTIPNDPASANFHQGKTLGAHYKHWRRATFYQQYRLFFRYDSTARVIVYAWVNDADTKRAYDSKSDAYRVFSRMLARGNPPNDWSELRRASRPLPVEG